MGSDLETPDLDVRDPSTAALSGNQDSLHLVPLDLAISPARLFARFAESPGLAFLDTSAPAGQTGSEGWSVLTAFPVETCLDELPPSKIGGTSAGTESHSGGARTSQRSWDPSGSISSRDRRSEPDLAEIPFATGWIGFASYESSSRWNPDLCHRQPAALPQTWWGRYAATLLYRHRDRQWLLAHRSDSEGEHARARLEQVCRGLEPSALGGVEPGSGEASSVTAAIDRELRFSADEPRAAISAGDHEARVREILHWIERGHIYQANLTYPMHASFTGSPEALFLSLRVHNPAPFGAFLAPAPGLSVLSSSPELFLRVRGSRIETRPIKGTAPRTQVDRHADREQARRLFHSAKDRAELTMIVDLERNDLGRICRPGSVRTLPFPRVESYQRVHHLAATVQGELARSLSMEELFASTFPGGSVTGAPKIRAMEILRDLEVAPRWIYTGTLGSIDDRGHVDLALTIRTMWVAQEQVTFHVGGGIVADSIPECEWQETGHKAAAMVAALRNEIDSL